MENSPSEVTTSETHTSSKGKSRSMLKLVTMATVGVVVLVVVVLLGGTVFAFASNKNIPVFSSVVEQIEKTVVSDEKTAETVQDDISDSILSLFAKVAATQDESNKTVDATEEEINALIKNKVDTDAFDYDMELTLDIDTQGTSSSALLMDGTVTLNADGVVSMRKDNEILSSEMDLTYAASGSEISVSGEFRAKEDNIYLNFKDIPNLGFGDFSAIQNQWLVTNSEEALGVGSMVSGTDVASASESTTITLEDLKDLKELIHSDEVGSNITRVDDEVIEGVRTRCAKIALTPDDLVAIMQKSNELTGGETVLSQEELASYVEGVEALDIIMCSGRTDARLYKLEVITTIEGGLKLDMAIKMWNFNEDKTVEVPEDAIPLQDALTALQAALSSTEEETTEE